MTNPSSESEKLSAAQNETGDETHLIAVSAPAEVSELDLYQKREKIYTRKIEGFFQRVRLFTGWPLLAGFFCLPWLNWGDRQAVLFDLPARQFHILNITFWPQDFSMLAWLLAICAFALFFFTALFGRVWCGYSCPQTVWTSIFMWIEQKTEGSRNQRIKLDAAPWDGNKFIRKSLKHTLWFGFAFLTGFTFVGYFTPVFELGYQFFTLSVPAVTLFWVLLFSGLTYLNAGWMREQVCMYMCPYARFQSAMFDKDTLIVSYDAQRGEPRGSRKREVQYREVQHREVQYQQQGLGDCIDCQLCVQVCPTGIDIRDGLQYQCIGCALCVDACNSVMDKMGYSRNLVSYTTENRLEGKQTHILRLKTIGYGIAISVMCVLLGWKLISRQPLQLDVIRDRGQLYIETADGGIENTYQLKLMNMDQQSHSYFLEVDGIDELKIIGATEYQLQKGEVRTITLRLALDKEHLIKTPSAIYFHATRKDNATIKASRESRFLVPIN